MAGLRKELISEGLSLMKDVAVGKPKVKVELPDVSELEEKLKELYPQRIEKRTQSQKEPPVLEKPASTITRPTPRPELPTREETTAELKRRLGKELYRAELDLSSKLRIAGKPCDCLEAKHTLGLEAAAEELIAQEPTNPVYSEILQWIKNNHSKVTIEAIASGKYDDEYPKMAAEFKNFRKRIMGTAVLSAMTQPEKEITLEEAQKIAAQEAEQEVERKWQSQEKKPVI